MTFTLSISMANQVKCVNATDGKEDLSKNTELADQLMTLNDPIVLAWRSKSFKTEESANICYNIPNTLRNISTYLESKIITVNLPLKIKKSCIEASLKRDIKNTGYICKDNIPHKFENSSGNAPCITPELSDYVTFAVNEAINCVSPDTTPIDASFIMKKINNETGFNFFLGYNGGVGIGQLTSSPIKEVAGWNEKIKSKLVYNEGQAKAILAEIANSSKASCQSFKNILEEDLQTPPPSPARQANYCSWVSPGKGLARNLFYSLAYYRWIRDQVITPKLETKAPHLLEDADLVNSLTLVAYGPGGLTEAKTIIDKMRINSKTNPKKALDIVRNKSAYVKQTEDKMSELGLNKNGETCVE